MKERILFVGDLNEYSRSLQRYKTLIRLGYALEGVSTVLVPLKLGVKPNLLVRIASKIKVPWDTTGVNGKIRKLTRTDHFDAIWIEKGITIWPGTLRLIKNIAPTTHLISCSEDDMYAKHNRTLFYDCGLKYYDVVFTTKPYNLAELKLLGARRTELFFDAYDEDLHRPLNLSREDKKRFGCDVSFIGSFEKDRADHMLYLAKRGIKIVVWGNDWAPLMNKHPNLIIKGEHLYGEDYAKAINATKINLCFLRKINRDEITSRSVEIPACGGFMLGERTKRHLETFKDGEEAVFFGDDNELYAAIVKYLADDKSREKIAKAGRKRCLEGGLSHREQLTRMLSQVFHSRQSNR